jgi:hypothetical protein
MTDETPLNEGPDLVAILQAVDRKSIKETILSCLVILAARYGRTPRRRVVISTALVLSLVLVAVRYWHAWSTLVHFIR